MTDTPSLNSTLHHTIIKHIIDNGYAPKIYDLASLLRMSEEDTTTAPTNFLVSFTSGEWWENCAWCSLGVAIRTTIGANDRQVSINIRDGKIVESNCYIHFLAFD